MGRTFRHVQLELFEVTVHTFRLDFIEHTPIPGGNTSTQIPFQLFSVHGDVNSR